MSSAKPLSLLIEHTAETLSGLPVDRRIELLEAMLALAVSQRERGLLRAQIDTLHAAERSQMQLLLDLRTRRAAA